MMEDALAQRNRISPPRPGKARAALSLTHPNAAGIDIGSA
jgi:transposase